ncbi:hypothetical protein BaRGS_00028735 [Batillaria attramentaria]|uniref:Uncharacterized protein n=1 Tax=Batillaria attramentaria TaxID=370345 RepID=A0ABD0JZ45_9CAEN
MWFRPRVKEDDPMIWFRCLITFLSSRMRSVGEATQRCCARRLVADWISHRTGRKGDERVLLQEFSYFSTLDVRRATALMPSARNLMAANKKNLTDQGELCNLIPIRALRLDMIGCGTKYTPQIPGSLVAASDKLASR